MEFRDLYSALWLTSSCGYEVLTLTMSKFNLLMCKYMGVKGLWSHRLQNKCKTILMWWLSVSWCWISRKILYSKKYTELYPAYMNGVFLYTITSHVTWQRGMSPVSGIFSAIPRFCVEGLPKILNFGYFYIDLVANW